MRGISFEIDNNYDKQLCKILSNIDVCDYTWVISEDEIYVKDDLGKQFFSKKVIDGKEFLEIISKGDYYIIFANIKAFSNREITSKINDHKDFISSSCDFILLCSDSVFVEFYAKDISIIEKVKSACITHMYQNIKYITDENDNRTFFYVNSIIK